MSTARELLGWASGVFSGAGRPEPELNAELLLEYVCDRPRLHFRIEAEETIPPSQETRFKRLVRQRATGVPLAYITGFQHFRGLEIKVTRAVLIPRPETEELAGLILSGLVKYPSQSPLVLELCTGSGCLPCAIASEMPSCRVIASDISAPALRVARANAQRLGLDGRIAFKQSDFFKSLKGKTDCIAANPPYVPAGELLSAQKELSFEPALALDGGPDGLSAARKIITGAPAHLKPGGLLFLELGSGQARRLAREMDAKIWDNIVIARDLQGVERFLSAKLKTEAI